MQTANATAVCFSGGEKIVEGKPGLDQNHPVKTHMHLLRGLRGTYIHLSHLRVDQLLPTLPKYQKTELNKRLEEKRKRREQREADSRRRKEKRRRDDEARALRQQMGSSAKEADRLRAKLRGRAEQTARARAREALWR